LVLDASSGPVSVQALGAGGLDVVGGKLLTTGTSADTRVTFSPVSPALVGAWAGISVEHSPYATGVPNDGEVALTDTDIAKAVTGVTATDARSVELTNVTIADTSSHGVWTTRTPLVAEGIRVANAGADGVLADRVRDGGTTLRGVSVDHAAAYGLEVHEGPVVLDGIQVTNSGTTGPTHPAIRLYGVRMTLAGTQATVRDLTGGGNGIDAVVLDGLITGDAELLGATNSPTVHQLGHILGRLTVQGPAEVSIRSGSILKGLADPPDTFYPTPSGIQATPVLLRGVHLTAPAGAVITSIGDDTLGPATCGSVLAPDCSQLFGGIRLTTEVETEGKGAQSRVDLHGVRFQQSVTALALDAGMPCFGCPPVMPPATTMTLVDTVISNCLQGLLINHSSATVQLTNFSTAGVARNSVRAAADTLDVVRGTFTDSPEDGSILGVDLKSLLLHDVTLRNVRGGGRGAVVTEISGLDFSTPFVSSPPSRGYTRVIAQGVHVENSGAGYPNSPAATFVGAKVSFGPQGVGPVIGHGNSVNAIAFSGSLLSNLTWRNPPEDDGTDVVFGYRIGNLTVDGPFTFTALPGARIPIAGIVFKGARLDASLGGVTFTPDATAGLLPQIAFAASPDGLLKGNGALIGASLAGVSLASGSGALASGPFPAGLYVKDTIVSGVSVSQGGSLTVRGGDVGSVNADASLIDVQGTRMGTGPTDRGGANVQRAIGITTLRNNEIHGCVRVWADYEGPSARVNLTDNTVSDCTSGPLSQVPAYRVFPIELLGVVTEIGPLGLANNVGKANVTNTILISGEINSDVAIGSVASDASALRPFGFAITYQRSRLSSPYERGLVVHGPFTVSVPTGRPLYLEPTGNYGATALTLVGANLDMGAGSGVTVIGGDLAKTSRCDTDTMDCKSDRDYPGTSHGIIVHRDPLTSRAGWVRVRSAAFRFSPLIVDSGAQSSPDGNFGVSITGSTFEGTYIDVSGSPTSLTSSVVAPHTPNLLLDGPRTYNGVSIHHSSGNVFSGNRLAVRESAAVYLDDAAASMTTNSFFIDRAPIFGGGSAYISMGLPYAVWAVGSPVNMRCSSLHDLTGGVRLPGGSTFTDSDLYNNAKDTTYPPPIESSWDLRGDGPGIKANRVWWGQASGPTSRQVRSTDPVDTSSPATTQRPIAGISASDTRTGPGGTFKPGVMTVRLTFNRMMDTAITPMVTLTGPDRVAHRISGKWSNAAVWAGTYTLTTTNSRSGPNTINASEARSCIPDSARNLMMPASKNVVLATSTTGLSRMYRPDRPVSDS
jgi:hypothetical protein